MRTGLSATFPTIMSPLIQTAERNTEDGDYAKGVPELVCDDEREKYRGRQGERGDSFLFQSKGREIKKKFDSGHLLKSLLTPCAISTPLRVQGQ